MILPVHFPAQGRPLQGTSPKIKGKRHQRIKLTIGQGNINES